MVKWKINIYLRQKVMENQYYYSDICNEGKRTVYCIECIAYRSKQRQQMDSYIQCDCKILETIYNGGKEKHMLIGLFFASPSNWLEFREQNKHKRDEREPNAPETFICNCNNNKIIIIDFQWARKNPKFVENSLWHGKITFFVSNDERIYASVLYVYIHRKRKRKIKCS